MGRSVAAGIAGILFGIGLTVSGMANPAKVIGFLDLFGNWDPSLALVMGGAVGVTAILFPRVTRREQPLLDGSFHLPTRSDIDPALVVGSGLFGIGWGLVGLCPGPAYTSLSLGKWEPWVFVAAMLAGMVLFRLVRRLPEIERQGAAVDG